MGRYVYRLLALVLVIVTAESASAFEIRFVESGTDIDLGDGSFVLELRLDAPNPGISLFGLSVLFDPTFVSYDPGSSSVPTYLLYSSLPAVRYLVPSQSPPQLWPAPPPGMQQINVNYQESTLDETIATGTNIHIGFLAFDIVSASGMSEISLSLSSGGSIFRVNGSDISDQVTLGAPVNLIPEPATGALVALGMAALVLARRWRHHS